MCTHPEMDTIRVTGTSSPRMLCSELYGSLAVPLESVKGRSGADTILETSFSTFTKKWSGRMGIRASMDFSEGGFHIRVFIAANNELQSYEQKC